MIQARRLGHMTLETPDLQRQIDYFTETLGLILVHRDQDHAYLGTKVGHLAVQLDRASKAQCTKLTFQVAPDSDFKDLAKRLSALGIASEMRTDPIPGVGSALAFKDPKGTTIELFTDWKAIGDGREHGVSPMKLGHVAFVVDDLAKIHEFYSKVLGFRVSDWIEDWFVFMRCSPDHHTVNFVAGKGNFLHHMAFELKDWGQLQPTCDFLAKKKIPIIWGPLRHGPGHNIAIYYRDPDDQIIENFVQLDQMNDEALGYFEPRPWHRDNPQRPKVWQRPGSDIWGPPPTPDFLRTR
jgi:catechol 2,3-dioxygenase-like lactoylglutathione lyase family enzyme